MEGLERQQSTNQQSDDSEGGWDDYYNEDEYPPMNLQHKASEKYEPKLTRGFSFTMIDDAEIEGK